MEICNSAFPQHAKCICLHVCLLNQYARHYKCLRGLRGVVEPSHFKLMCFYFFPLCSEWYMNGNYLVIIVSIAVILPLALMKQLGKYSTWYIM